MKMRSKLGIALATSAFGLGSLMGLAGPANAADTEATFTLTAGSLSVTAPASSALGSVATGTASTTAAQLGTVSVTDNRGANLGTWTASASSSDFTTGGATADETIAKANAHYWSGLETASSGTAVFLPGQATALDKESLSASITAFSASAIVGNNSASWDPTFNVDIPSDSVAGEYTGTVTHSVA